jgi:hypothetical protein
MPLVLADRVKETTTTTGTGTITLLGAATGFQAFSVIGNGNTTYYTIAGQGTNEWEVGVGTYTASGTTLSRDTVLSSSAGAPTKTNFSAGTKDVFVTYPSERAVYSDGTNIVPDNPAVLLPSSGGTGQTSYVNGELLIGNTTGNTLTKATLTQGTGITVTNGAGSITVTNAGVTSVAAGTGISVSAATGGVTISSTVSGGGDYALRSFVSPTTWSKPAGLKQIKVTVVGAGGAGGATPAGASGGGGSGGAAISWIPAPSIPGPQPITAGAGTNSFGGFCSATAGGAGANGTTLGGIAGGTGGAGSGGTININGGRGGWGFASPAAPALPFTGGGAPSILGNGGASQVTPAPVAVTGFPGSGYGSGGSGVQRSPATVPPATTGAPGIVIVEEFY